MLSYHWTTGHCYLCAQPRISEVAESLCEPDVMENGSWTDDLFTKEKSAKWGEALVKAEEQLKSLVVEITFDCENGYLCVNCLRKILDEGGEQYE